jgi:SulP family sulfate permease
MVYEYEHTNLPPSHTITLNEHFDSVKLVGTPSVANSAAAPEPDDQPSSHGESKPKGFAPTFFRLVPAFESLRRYSARDLGRDVLAGLTVAAVAVPQAMAYARIADLPVYYGLYTAIVMTIVGALFDSSRQLINGPTNAISIALLSALAFVPAGERIAAAILVAFLVGAFQTGITLLRLGDLSRYISHAVIVGFTLGAAVLLVLDQLKNLLGLPAQGDAHDHFLTKFWLTLCQIESTHAWTLALGLGTMVVVLILSQVGAKWGLRLPEFLIAVALAALVVWFFQLDRLPRPVRIVGEIPAHLPAFQFPELSWTNVRGLAGSSLAIAILGLLEAVAMAKAIAARTKQKLDINQQCLSEGLANLSGSFFQCMPGSGSLTRSAINVHAGAVSQWSGVFSAIAVALTVLYLAPFAYYIPYASLAGILMISAWRLVDRQQLLYHLRTTRFDAGIVIVTALSAVVVSVEFCILIGVFLSFVLFVPRAARLHLTELTITPERVIKERGAGDMPCTRILLFSLEGELFFGSAPDLERNFEAIQAKLRKETRAVVLRLKRVRNPDAVCLELFQHFLEDMQARGVTVLLCGVRPDLARALHSSGLEAKLGPHRVFLEGGAVFSSTLDAVRHAYEILGDDLCEECPRRKELKKEVLYYMI